MQQEATRQMEARLDHRQYDASQLISIKVPLTHLSYYNHSVDFERVDGEIELNGIPYQYVKQRIYNDSLELLCIPNQLALKLRLSGEEYFRTVNDLQHCSRDQHQPAHPFSGKSFVSDPYTIITFFQLEAMPSISIMHRCYYSLLILSIPRTTEERPPAAIA